MTQEQKNLLIALVVIAVVAGGAYYFNKNKDEITTSFEPEGSQSLNDPTPPSEGGEDAGEPSTPEAGGVPAKGGGGGVITNTNSDAAKQAELLAKFNLALSNGHKEFGKGNYSAALKYYEEALKYKQADVAYSGMFNVYTAQKNWVKAEWAINKALDLNSRYTEYWKAKLTLLDERTSASYVELKAIYENGLAKNDARTAINLVTHFAVIAEANGQKEEAISLWEYAKTLNPAKTAIYQAEIDRLKS